MKKHFIKIQLLLLAILSVNISYAQFSGGNADGFAYLSFAEADDISLAIYSGNTHDGFSSVSFAEVDNPAIAIYNGGNTDGFAWLNFVQADNPTVKIYKGGSADGFAWLNFAQADNPSLIFYSGGSADGYAWKNYEEPDNPALIFYSGGNADGFAWLNYEELEIPADMIYSGGQSDGFAWLNYNVGFYWEGDDLVSPNDWFTPENWSANAIPTINDDIEIPIVASNQYPKISGNAESRTVIIYNGASTTINPDGSYSVSGAFVNDGSFTMLADATNRSSFIDNGSISGIGVNRILSYLIGNNFHYVSSPIQTPDIDPLSNSTSDLFTSGCSSFNLNFFKYDETYDLDGNPLTSPAGVFDPDNLVPGWNYAHGGVGVPVDLDIKLGYAHFDICDKLVEFVGIPNTGTVSYNNLSYTNNDPMPGPLPNYYDGWQLVSNPFPSSVDWDAVSSTPNNLDDFDNAIYVWRGDAVTGSYEEYVNGISGGTGLLDRYIPPGQAYFIHSKVDNASFEINNSHRIHSNATFLKKNNTELNDLLKLKVEKNNLSTYTTIYFTENSTTEFDGNTDAFKIFGEYSNVPQFYMVTPIESLKLSINAIPKDSIYNLTVPLGIRSADGGDSQISISKLSGIDNVHIYLKDALYDSLQNLKIKSTYDFNIPDGDISNRFSILFLLNSAPQISDTIKSRTIFEDELFSLNLNNSFIDNDFKDSLIYTASLENNQVLPNWITFDSNNVVLSGTPTNSDVGKLTVILTASDILGKTCSQTFDLNIINVNDKPTLINPIQDIKAYTNDYFEYQIPINTFNDIDLGDSLTYSVSYYGEAPFAWLNYNTENRTLYGIPNMSGEIKVKVIATDKFGAFANDYFNIYVENTSKVNNINTRQLVINPNPTKGKITIYTSFPEKEKGELSISDVTGKIIFNSEFMGNEILLNLSNYEDGIYFLKVQTKSHNFMGKIVLRK